ncbi:uncharacterized protein LOC127004253 isoform X2 [Eriocheir sinensis]|uniref:uncharacterized protein LOC127004253 isoform X2 n=1 Tax=Eriocheir sinensis TaxID=95602 RepID=UPI0021CA34BA|nr:uncharacterized protein LOC127004253 isoform X2 [Eriocheir sinensis]
MTTAVVSRLLGQLFYDGHQNFAQELAVIVDQEATAVSPSDRLMNIITIGLQHEHDLGRDPDAVEVHPDAVVGHPVIRTLYDHLDEITCLEFHPREQILISGSRDTNIKMFDFSKTSAKKACKTLNGRRTGDQYVHPPQWRLLGRHHRGASGEVLRHQHVPVLRVSLPPGAPCWAPHQRALLCRRPCVCQRLQGRGHQNLG